MRMFTEIGQRVDLHSTGVGKALLSQLDSAQVDDLLDRRGLPDRTEHTSLVAFGSTRNSSGFDRRDSPSMNRSRN